MLRACAALRGRRGEWWQFGFGWGITSDRHEALDGAKEVKVFISWSGERSRAVADLMSVWIKCVLQASEPWISTKHIDRGALWFSEINEKLRDVSVGIVCLTESPRVF